MNNYVFKYHIPITNQIIELEIPYDAEYCDIQSIDDEIFIWFIIDSHEERKIKKHFKIFGTGHPIGDADNYFYLKTVQMPNKLVWHVFEMNE